MENRMSRILVGSVVREGLENIKKDPERRIRNLVDMALEFSKGQFQEHFFSAAQTILQNEGSGYYELIRDIVDHVETDCLYTFGMNLGYNGCTVGAKKIKENEDQRNHNIPWAVVLQIDTEKWQTTNTRYHEVIREGESLGIYVWMLFVRENPQVMLSLAQAHPDSAFILFCEPEDLTPPVLSEIKKTKNLMLTIRYQEDTVNLCADLREAGLLYSVWYQYGQTELEMIVNGTLFLQTQKCHPVFTVLLPKPECPEMIRQLVYQALVRIRKDAAYRTIPWEMKIDNCRIDAVISNDTCSAHFDQDGILYEWGGITHKTSCNLFLNSLPDILNCAFPKRQQHSGKKPDTAAQTAHI